MVNSRNNIIEEDNLTGFEEGPQDRQALLLAPGQGRGFFVGVFTQSDPFKNSLGTLLPACLVLALLADLLLVPAMAAVGWIRFQKAAPQA